MSTDSIVYSKAYVFSKKIIRLSQFLAHEKKEFVMSKQLIRSGTSVGANIKEAINGQTRKDFLYKMNIALKEANETEYWLELLIDTDFLDRKRNDSILIDCKELCKILNRIVYTTKKQL